MTKPKTRFQLPIGTNTIAVWALWSRDGKPAVIMRLDRGENGQYGCSTTYGTRPDQQQHFESRFPSDLEAIEDMRTRITWLLEQKDGEWHSHRWEVLRGERTSAEFKQLIATMPATKLKRPE